MSREEAIEFARMLVAAVNEHDTALIVSLYKDDAIMISPMFPRVEGRAAIASNWERTFSLFPDWAVHLSDVMVDGDRVALLGTATGTDRNGWFGQPSTGERIDYRAIIYLTFANGKIVRDERVYDLTGVLQRLEKSRIDKELRMAADVQRTLLAHTRHLTPFCDAIASSIPCRAVGGDLFELAQLPSGDFLVALGDVAGKGPASALLAAMILGMLAIEREGECRVSTVLAHMNQILFRRGLEPRFATLVVGRLSPDGTFAYSNAGHNAPLLLTRNGIRRLTVGGPVLGAFSGSTFEEATVYLRDQDTIVLFSDGVTEAVDSAGAEFGEERLIKCSSELLAHPAPEMLQGILSAVRDFSRTTTLADDITVAVTRFLGGEILSESVDTVNEPQRPG
jgi:sigma-B regulation protein RsbU (phosphoserine phosphatase)